MIDYVLTDAELSALENLPGADLSDPVAFVLEHGLDARTFFEFGTWVGGDFTMSNLEGVSFKGADLFGASFRADQLGIVMGSFPRRGPLDGVECEEFRTNDELNAFVEARRRIAVACSEGGLDLDLSDLRPLSIVPAEIESLSSLATLDLSNTEVANIQFLSNLSKLQSLDLHNSQVSDLGPLAHLSKLRTLYLHNTPVKFLAPLSGLSELERLHLDNTQADLLTLTAANAAWAKKDCALRDLTFRGTPATVEGGPLARLNREELTDIERTAEALALLRTEQAWINHKNVTAANIDQTKKQILHTLDNIVSYIGNTDLSEYENRIVHNYKVQLRKLHQPVRLNALFLKLKPALEDAITPAYLSEWANKEIDHLDLLHEKLLDQLDFDRGSHILGRGI